MATSQQLLLKTNQQTNQQHQPGVASSLLALPPPLPPTWTAAFVSAFRARLALMSDQAVSNTVWSLARLGVPVDPDLASRVIQHLLELDRQQMEIAGGDGDGGCCSGISGQALANTIWGLARPGTLALGDTSAAALEDMVRRRLVLGSSAVSAASATGGAQGDGGEDDAAAAAARRRRAAEALPLIFTPSEVASVLYSFAKLQHRPPADVADLLLDAVLGALPSPARCSSPRSPADHPLSGAGPLGAPRPPPLPSWEMSPRDLANTIWAVAALDIKPSGAWLDAFWASCCSYMSHFSAKDVAQTAYSLAKAGWKAGAGGGGGAISHPSVPSRGDGALSTTHTWVTGAHPEGKRTETGSSSRLSVNHALAPPASASSTVTPASVTSPAEPVLPPPDVTAFLTDAAACLPLCSSQDLSNLTWGIAQMGIRPPQGWCQALADCLVRQSESQLRGPDLATSVWALGKMGFKPKARSLVAVSGACVCVGRYWCAFGAGGRGFMRHQRRTIVADKGLGSADV
jgi:hypothetical protein